MISKNQIKMVKQLEQKKFRRKEGLFVAEGPKVVGDLMRCYAPHTVFATADWPGRADHIVTEEELRRLSFLQHPQQVLALFPIPDSTERPTPDAQPSATNSQLPPLALALDGVQDPGNLGTIIRIADWFGIDTVYCSQDTADAWSPKVVQATMGSIARVHIIYCSLPELLSSTTLPVYGTLLDGQSLYEQQLTPEGIIVMGNEGNGISAPVRQLIKNRLLIPDFHQGETAESLNVAVATAIVCAEFRRRSLRT